MQLRVVVVALLWSAAAYGTALAADSPPAPRPTTQPSTRPAGLTDSEREAGWKLIFDGTNTVGWRSLGGTDFPKDFWVVRDGCLVHPPGKGGGHDIVYDKPVENFELAWEWMIPKKNGNSGVKYRVQETKGKGGAFGPEYQMMADGDKSDKSATASLYDVLPPKGKKLKPDGEFNESRVVVKGNHVEHWLNGVKTVEFEFGSEELKAAIAQSKFKSSPQWAAVPKGFVALTDHGDEAWFRNIKLREIK